MTDSISTCRICLQPIEPDRNVCWVCFSELSPSAASTPDNVGVPADDESVGEPKNKKRAATAGQWLAIFGGTLMVGLLSGLATLFVVGLLISAFIASVFTAIGEVCSSMGP